MSFALPPPSLKNAIVDERTAQDDDAWNNTNNAKDSNFNLVCDDFNIASVSMPVYILFYLFFVLV